MSRLVRGVLDCAMIFFVSWFVMEATKSIIFAIVAALIVAMYGVMAFIDGFITARRGNKEK